MKIHCTVLIPKSLGSLSKNTSFFSNKINSCSTKQNTAQSAVRHCAAITDDVRAHAGQLMLTARQFEFFVSLLFYSYEKFV